MNSKDIEIKSKEPRLSLSSASSLSLSSPSSF
jgi:hypothetical protein